MSGSRSSAATRTPESPKQSARKRKDLSDLLVVGGAPVRRRQASTGGAIFVRHGTRCCSLACFFFFLGSVPLRSSCSVGDSSSADVRSSPDLLGSLAGFRLSAPFPATISNGALAGAAPRVALYVDTTKLKERSGRLRSLSLFPRLMRRVAHSVPPRF